MLAYPKEKRTAVPTAVIREILSETRITAKQRGILERRLELAEQRESSDVLDWLPSSAEVRKRLARAVREANVLRQLLRVITRAENCLSDEQLRVEDPWDQIAEGRT